MKSKYLTHPLLFILVAYIFAIGCRLIWVAEFSGEQSYKYNNEFMINTNDGYYWAEGARDILNGTHEANDLSPVDKAPAILTAFLVKVLPFSLETIIFYMPAFFGALIVIPLFLIGQSLGRNETGFIAALIGSIAWSYYNRTMVGYYDTDALNIVFPVFLLWSLILYFETWAEKYLLFTAFEIIAYRWWYPASYSLEVSNFILILAFCFYLFWHFRKQIFVMDEFINAVKLMSISLTAMMMLPEYIRLVAVIGLYFVFKQEKFDKYIYYIFGLVFVGFIATGGFNPVWFYLKSYVFKSTTSLDANVTLHFFGVMQTIREAGSVPFYEFANRISGNTILFLASFIGYILMVYRYRVMLFGLPLLGLGFIAFGIPGLVPSAGLRFTIYAVPVMALGGGYVIYLLSNEIGSFFGKKKAFAIAKYTIATILSIGFLFPNIVHIKEYAVPPVFSVSEVEQLEQFKKIAQREDYVISWWDYGYPIRYYADTKTLVDGGKHNGDNNFPASFCLLENQAKSSKMARLAVEMTENGKGVYADVISQMLKTYNYKDSSIFLDSLEIDEIKMPPKTRDVFMYLPYRMMEIVPTIALFSNLNLSTGAPYNANLFATATFEKEENGTIYLSDNIKLEKTGAKLTINNQEVSIKEFITTSYGSDNKFNKTVQTLDFSSNISVIFMKSYNQFLIIDSKMKDSTYIKLFVLEDYDKNLFEQVLTSPYSKIYKLKI